MLMYSLYGQYNQSLYSKVCTGWTALFDPVSGAVGSDVVDRELPNVMMKHCIIIYTITSILHVLYWCWSVIRFCWGEVGQQWVILNVQYSSCGVPLCFNTHMNEILSTRQMWLKVCDIFRLHKVDSLVRSPETQ